MNPTFKEDVIDFVDIKLLGIICNKCKTELIIDMTGDKKIIPNFCQSCGSRINEAFLEAIGTFFNVYKYLIEKEDSASVRIRLRQEMKIDEI